MIHKLLDQLSNLKINFARAPRLDLEAGLLECDCSGLITLLLKESGRWPKGLPDNPRAYQYFDYFKSGKPKKTIQELKRFDVLAWRKTDVPKSGDSGHLLLLTNRPKKLKENQFLVPIAEVTKSSPKIVFRNIEIHTLKDGTLNRVKWDTETNKVKETEILGHSLFESEDCKQCLFPKSRCLCEILPQEKWRSPEIVIFRHPSEEKHPYATVPLLQLSLTGLKIEESEIFPKRKGTLVFPRNSENGIVVSERNELPEIELPLILLDGTWKKTKKILFLNPWLNELPRLEIERDSSSQYRIRKQKDEASYSTLETVAFLWKKLDPNQKEKANHLLRIFDTFIEKQESFFR